MKILKIAALAAGPMSLVGFLATQAVAAGACTTLSAVNGSHRLFPTIQQIQDFVDISCGGTSATVAASQNAAGTKAVAVLLTAGSGTDLARVDGLDNAGVLIGTCTATDLPPVNGSNVTDNVGCNAAVRWKGQVKF